MEINNVRYVNFAIGDRNSGAQKKAQEEVETKAPVVSQQEVSKTDVNEFSPALDIAGAQFKASINKVQPKELSPERVKDIEAMMAEFENGVNMVADTIDAEFPGFFAPDAKLALAAEIYATYQG